MIITGIYTITNKINNRVYIGSSKDINRRWKQHINDLNKSKHINQSLQDDWIKYGQNNFDFNVVRQCDESELKYAELDEIFSSWDVLYNAPSLKDEVVYLVCNYLKDKNKDFMIDHKSDNCFDKRALNFNIFAYSGEKKELYLSLRNLDYVCSPEDEEKYQKSSVAKRQYVDNRAGDLIEIEYGH